MAYIPVNIIHLFVFSNSMASSSVYLRQTERGHRFESIYYTLRREGSNGHCAAALGQSALQARRARCF